MTMNLGRLGLGFGRMGTFAGGSGDFAASTVSRYGTPAILLSGLDPARLTASGLSPSYLESTGLTAAASSGQTLGLLLERSLGAALGTELVTNGGFTTDTAWTKGTGWTISGGAASFSAGSGAVLSQAIAFGIGTYQITFTVLPGISGSVLVQISAPGVVLSSSVAAAGTYTFRLVNALARTTLGFSATAGAALSIDNASCKLVAGNHLYQVTAADEPTLILDNGIWRLRGDGLTKNFLTPLVPAASMTMMVACEFNAASDMALGSAGVLNTDNCFLGTDSGGGLAAGVGTNGILTIFRVGDIRDVPGVAALRFNGTTVSLFWKPLSGALDKAYEAAQAGSPTTTVPIRVGARNVAGTANALLDGDIYRVLAQQSAYTDAEISAIASQWSRELGGTG